MADAASFAVLPEEQQALLKAACVFPAAFSVYGAAHMLAGKADAPPAIPAAAPDATALVEPPRAFVEDAQRIINDLCAADLIQTVTESPVLPRPVPVDAIPANGRRAFKLRADARAQAQRAAGSELAAYQQVYKDAVLLQLNTWALRYTEAGCIKALQMAMVYASDTEEVRARLRARAPVCRADTLRPGGGALPKSSSRSMYACMHFAGWRLGGCLP